MKKYEVCLSGLTSLDVTLEVPDGVDVGDYINDHVWDLPLIKLMVKSLMSSESTVDFTVYNWNEEGNNA